jgi:hypothetical protein
MHKTRLMYLGLIGIVFYGFAATDYNDIDAVSSASSLFRIISGKAYKTSAQITWWDYYNNGSQHVLKYGTSSSYGQQINLKPFTANTNVTTTIPNLQPGTKYYIQFYRFYEGQAHSTNDTFVTFSETMIRPQRGQNAIPANELGGKTIDIYLPDGKRIVSYSIPAGSTRHLFEQGISKRFGLQNGVYLFVVRDREKILFRTKKAVFQQ